MLYKDLQEEIGKLTGGMLYMKILIKEKKLIFATSHQKMIMK